MSIILGTRASPEGPPDAILALDMADTLPMGDGANRETGLSDSTRKCAQCGDAFSGPIHNPCPADSRTTAYPPERIPRPHLDDLPPEAAEAAADPARALHQYVLVRQIGKGGMGAVWKAWDRKLTRWVAIKFLLAEDRDGIARFEREAKLAARLRHPNIAAIYDVGTGPARQLGQETAHYLAMEFVEGRTLAFGEYAFSEVLEIFISVARAIHFAHQAGVIHRDLKPANIMIGRNRWPYVMDFGLAKALEADSSLSTPGSILGTPAYMPPEQAEGRMEEADVRSDVYSLGATLYAILLGQPPFAGSSVLQILRKVCTESFPLPRSLKPDFPPVVEAILLKAMAKDPKDRFSSAEALAESLSRYLAGERPLAPPSVPSRPAGRRIAVGIAGLLVLAGAAAYLAKTDPPSSIPPAQTNVEPAPVRPRHRPVPFPTVSAGTFSIRFAVHPFATIVRVLRDQEPVAMDLESTPGLKTGLELGDYVIVLRHPKWGERSVALPRERIQAGKTYVIWGRMENASLDVAELP
jgi:serine/threonine protein kinase